MADPTVLGTIQIQALPVASKPDGTELLHVKQGTADKRTTIAEAIAVHGDLHNNPHGVDNIQVGLGNVTNDAQLKITSNLNDLSDKSVARTNLDVYSKGETDTKFTPQVRTINGHPLTSDVTITQSDVGLSNVPNYQKSDDYREDADKLSTARAVSALFRAIQAETPPGTIIHTYDDRDPSTYKLCGGIWQLIGKGRTLVGYDETNPARPVGTEFGSATVKLTTQNLPKHSHPVNITSGNHSHGVVGNTVGGGGHQHNVNGTTSSYNYGTLSGTTANSGGHNHSGNTGMSGNHRHTFGGDDRLDIFNEIAEENSARYDADSDTDQWAKRYWTSWAGDHSHAFTTSWGGEHAHSFSLNIGAHGHTISGTAASVPDHIHGINFASQTSTVNIIGNTDNVGGDIPVNIEQPSLVCYIWKRVS